MNYQVKHKRLIKLPSLIFINLLSTYFLNYIIHIPYSTIEYLLLFL